jgi:hypothetical protein
MDSWHVLDTCCRSDDLRDLGVGGEDFGGTEVADGVVMLLSKIGNC